MYNVQTLKKLIEVGEKTPNLMIHLNMHYNESVADTKDEWRDLSVTLKFCQKEDTECDIRRAYLLYFWINSLVELTF